MRLAKLTEFRQLVYTRESAPSLETLRVRVQKDLIPGGRVELGRYYVDLDEFDRVCGLRSSLDAQIRQMKNDPLLEGLI